MIMLENSASVVNGFYSSSCSARAPLCLNEQTCAELIGSTQKFHWSNYEKCQALIGFTEGNSDLPNPKRRKISLVHFLKEIRFCDHTP